MVTEPGFLGSASALSVGSTVTRRTTPSCCALQVKRTGKMEQLKSWLSHRRSTPTGDMFEHLASTETEPFGDVRESRRTRETSGLVGSQVYIAMDLPAWV